jgi:transposase-like protein
MAVRKKIRQKRIHQMTIPQWEAAFPNEDACCAYLAGNRWPTGVACPRCGNVKIKEHGTMPYNWLCNACSPSSTNYRFSVIAGTIFENTNKPLRDWFRVVHMMLTSKKGISALQVMRVMGFGSYKTAWYMCHRVRAGLANEEFRKLMGIVEVDETFIGGDDGNRHQNKKVGRHWRDAKTPVIGAVQRGGKVVARVIENCRTETLEAFIAQTVGTEVSLLATDEHKGYADLPRSGYHHGTVNHSEKRYVVGAIHTNTIEGFWSILKRGVMGTYHKVSKKYLPLYVAEFQFRYNNRLNEDIFGEAIRGC